MVGRTISHILACVVLCSASAAYAVPLKAPPGSFTTRPVSDVEDFCAILRQDKRAAARYAKHFNMSTTALAEYFRKNVKPVTVQRAGRYTAWYIDKRGQMQVRRKELTPGAKVFVTFNGQVIMERRCGNPLTKSLPKPIAKVKSEQQTLAQAQPKPVQKPQEKTDPIAQALSTDQQVVAQAPTPAPAPAATTQTEPTMQVLAEAPMELVAAPAAAAAASSGLRWVLPALAGVGAAGTLTGGGHGATRQPAPVPEPGSLLLLGSGIATVLYPGLRRVRSARNTELKRMN